MRIFLRTEDEIELMRMIDHLMRKMLEEGGRQVKPKVSILKWDAVTKEFIRDNDTSQFSIVAPTCMEINFSKSICTSFNDIVAHSVIQDFWEALEVTGKSNAYTTWYQKQDVRRIPVVPLITGGMIMGLC